MTTANVNIKKVLLKRGNTTQNDNYLGVYGEVSVDMEAKTLRIHDGATTGGFTVSSGGGGGGGDYGNVDVATFLRHFNSNIVPSANLQYSLGDATHWWKSLYVSSNTIFIGGVPLTIDQDQNLLINGNIIQGGNVDAVNSNVAVIDANIGAYQRWANTNAAVQSTSINTVNANIGAYQTWANANAAAQSTSLTTINANIGAYHTYANLTFSTVANAAIAHNELNTLRSDLNGANARILSNYTFLLSNAGVAHSEIDLLRANITAANANVVANYNFLLANAGRAHSEIDGLRANITAANSAITTSNTGMKSYVDTVTTAWTANAGTQQTQINLLNANVAAANAVIAGIQTGSGFATVEQITANIATVTANAGTQQTQINSINANVAAANTTISAVTTAWTANAGVQATDINALRANITAANTVIATLQTQTYSNVNTAAYLAGAITTGNITAGNLTVENNAVILGNLRVAGTQTTVNASTLNITDLWVTVADGAIQASDANGAGLRIDGALANIAYSSITDSFEFNKSITFLDDTIQTTAWTGNIDSTGAHINFSASAVGHNPGNGTITFADGSLQSTAWLGTVANLTYGANVVALNVDGNLLLPNNMVFTTSPAVSGTGIIFGDGSYQNTAWTGNVARLTNNGNDVVLGPDGALTIVNAISAQSGQYLFLGSDTSTEMSWSNSVQAPNTGVYSGVGSNSDGTAISVASTDSEGAWVFKTWDFGMSGNLEVPGTINFQQLTGTHRLNAPRSDGASDQIRLFDFYNGNPSGYNYAIGVEPDHVWLSTDHITDTGGFKFYGQGNLAAKIGGAGTITLGENSTGIFWNNGAAYSSGVGTTYSNTNVSAYLDSGISSNIKTTANVIAPNYLFANGVNILSTVSGGTGNALVNGGYTVRLQANGVLTLGGTATISNDGEFRLWADNDITVYRNGQDGYAVKTGSIENWINNSLATVINSSNVEIKTANLIIPNNKRIYFANGTAYSAGGTTTNTIGVVTDNEAPTSPSQGDLWFNTADGRTYVRWLDTWIDANPTVLTTGSVTFDDDVIGFTSGNLTVNVDDGLVVLGNVIIEKDGNYWVMGTSYDGGQDSYGPEGIRINPGIEGSADLRLPSDDDASTESARITNYNSTGNVEVSANNSTWKFDYQGNLVLPTGGNINYANGSSILTGITASTGGNTITTGNIIGNNTDPNVYIETTSSGNTSVWTFGTNGVLTLPANTAIIQGAGAGSNVNIVSSDGTTTATWRFDKYGNITLPTSANINYANGRSILSGIGGGSADTGNIRFNGSTVYSSYEPDNIYIDTTGGDYTWTFGADGSTQFPGDAIKAPAGRFVSLSDNAGMNFVTVSDTEVTISTQDTTEYNWTFGTDGELTLGGNLTLAGRVRPQYISGFVRMPDSTSYRDGATLLLGGETNGDFPYIITTPPGTADSQSGKSIIIQASEGYGEGDSYVPGGAVTIAGGYTTGGTGAKITVYGGGGEGGPGPNSGNVDITAGWDLGSFNDPQIALDISGPESGYYQGGKINFKTSQYQNANVNVWSMDVYGTLTTAGSVRMAPGGRFITDGSTGTTGAHWVNFPDADNQGIIRIYEDEGTVQNAAITLDNRANISIRTTDNSDGIGYGGPDNTWTFSNIGGLTLPGGSTITENGALILTPYGAASEQKLKIYPTMGPGEGDHLHLTSGDLGTTSIFLGSDSLYVRTRADGAMVIGTDDVAPDEAGYGYRWVFDGDGTTTFPDHKPVTITGNLTVGNLTVNGNSTIINTTSYSVTDNIIQMAADNPADTLDIGFVGHRTVNGELQHTGLVRDASTGIWELFSNVTTQPGTTVDFTQAILDDLQLDKLYADTVHLSGTPPSTVAGAAGDLAGDIHIDANYLYYCTTNWAASSYTVGWEGSIGDTLFITKGDYPTPQVGWIVDQGGNGPWTIDTIVDNGTSWQITWVGSNFGSPGGGTALLTNPNPPAIWKTVPLNTFQTAVAGTYANANVEAYIGANIGAYQTWANATFSTGGGSTYSNTNVAAYLDSGISSNIKTTANVIAPNYLFANGVNILSTVSAGSSYANADAAAYLAANSAIYLGNPATRYPLQANVTQTFIGNTTTIGAGSNQLGGTYILNNAYFGANGAMYARNTQTGAAQYRVSGGTFDWAGTIGAVTANSVQSFALWAQLNNNGLITYNSTPITSSGLLTASAGLSITSAVGITTTQATFPLVNATATTINFGGAATTLNMGASTGTTRINNALTVTGSATIGGTFTVSGATANLSLVAVTANTVTANNATFNSNITVGNITTTGTYGNITGANVISANTFIASGNIRITGTGGNIATTYPVYFDASTNQLSRSIMPRVSAYYSTSTQTFNWSDVFKPDTVELNIGSIYDSSTGVFTPTVPGWYKISLVLWTQSSSTGWYAQFSKAGTASASNNSVIVGDITISSTKVMNGSTVLYFNGTTDTAAVYMYAGIFSGSDTVVTRGSGYFNSKLSALTFEWVSP